MAKRHEQKKEAARRMREQQKREHRKKQLQVGSAILAVVVVVAGIAGAALYLNQGFEVHEPNAETANGGIVVGDGEVTVDVYADYICPNCGTFEQSSGEVINEYVSSGDIELRFHPLGLMDNQSSDKYSSRAAASAVCAADEDPEKFLEYNTELFNNQPAEGGEGLGNEELVSIGSDVGFGKSFEKCVTDDKYRGWVNEETEKAVSDGFNSTPSVVINDNKLEDHGTFNDELEKAVKEAGDSGEEKEESESS